MMDAGIRQRADWNSRELLSSGWSQSAGDKVAVADTGDTGRGDKPEGDLCAADDRGAGGADIGRYAN